MSAIFHPFPAELEALTTLSMVPVVLEMSVAHEQTESGPVTLIVRTVQEPQRCTMCPRSMCNHGKHFCCVRVPKHLDDSLCSTYTIGRTR